MKNIPKNFPLSKITTLKIGGPAKMFTVVKTQQKLIYSINFAKEKSIPFLIIGSGSNLLVSDKGFDGLVIKNEITGIKQNKNIVVVQSGTLLQDLVDFTISHGLSGLQSLTGIPGTLGGAIYGNAGAYGQTISDHITSVVILNTSVIPAKAGIHINGSRIKYGMTGVDCQFNYRDSIFKKTKDIILEASFILEKGDPKKLKKESEEVLSKRLKKYPKGIKCPGSFFKNIVTEDLPQKILSKIPKESIVYGKLPAGVLLESVGAKGDYLGKIEIANYHANLFINKGGGRASDFYLLAKKYSKKVEDKFGIKLEPEVQLINLPLI